MAQHENIVLIYTQKYNFPCIHIILILPFVQLVQMQCKFYYKMLALSMWSIFFE